MPRNPLNKPRQFSLLRAFGPRVLLVAALGGGLAACQHEGPYLSPATPQPDVKDKYPITVSPRQETMLLSPVLVGKSLTDADARQVTAFAGGFLQEGHGPLAIILPAVPKTPQAAGQIEAINRVLADRGVPDSRIEWRIATPGNPAGAAQAQAANPASPAPALVFSYTRFVAAVEKECGNWPKDIGSYHNNQPWTNFGCAQQHNLAAMVSDPLDLKQPRTVTPVDVDRRTVVIKAYREGTATAAERTEAEKGTISEVAK